MESHLELFLDHSELLFHSLLLFRCCTFELFLHNLSLRVFYLHYASLKGLIRSFELGIFHLYS